MDFFKLKINITVVPGITVILSFFRFFLLQKFGYGKECYFCKIKDIPYY